MKRIVFVLMSMAGAMTAQAEVKLNAIFMDHMVLQRDVPLGIYGTAEAGEQVAVEFAGQNKTAAADAAGDWLVKLDPIKASSQGRTLKVSGWTANDVLVGDVWLCTGQSNMAGTVGSYVSYGGGKFQEFKNVPGDYTNDQIRLFTVGDAGEDQPQSETVVGQGWVVCNPQSALGFSCTGYFFGKNLQPEIEVPIGLIKCAYGGTSVGSWLPMDVMNSNAVATRIYLNPYRQAVKNYPQAKAAYDRVLARRKQDKKVRQPQQPMGPNHIKRPAAMYDGMLHPLHKFAVKGAIWYQGENEANAGFPEEYQTTFPLLIAAWRDRWEQGDFPFIFVQLAANGKVVPGPSDSDWARLREAQLHTMKTVRKTGMAVAIDGGLTTNIHPPYKELVGKRLAAQALEIAYGKEGVSQGPLFKSMTVKDGKAVLSFDHAGSGLMVKDTMMDAYGETPYALSSEELQGFAVAGADQVFHLADAVLNGDQVMVSSPAVPTPVAVRYAWANYPLCNLYNKEGFAAAPFRTDDWPKAE